MTWRKKEISIPTLSGARDVEGLVRRGIAIVSMYDSADETDFFSITHIETGARIAKLFCSENRAPEIADKVVELQDWTKVKGADDVLPATREALRALSVEHHVIV